MQKYSAVKFLSHCCRKRDTSKKIRLTAFIAPTGKATPYEMRQCDSSHVPFQDIS